MAKEPTHHPGVGFGGPFPPHPAALGCSHHYCCSWLPGVGLNVHLLPFPFQYEELLSAFLIVQDPWPQRRSGFIYLKMSLFPLRLFAYLLFKVNNSVVLVSSQCCICHIHHRISEYFYNLKKKPIVIPCFLFPKVLPTYFLSLWVPNLNTSHKICVLLCLASLMLHIFKVHPYCSMP